jgi:hypothetical protein
VGIVLAELNLRVPPPEYLQEDSCVVPAYWIPTGTIIAYKFFCVRKGTRGLSGYKYSMNFMEAS